ncbi:hypothetical protein PR048_004748 [Dryococelus australis]|uniref:Uncharacterized protein n=1 Tax=Dryococelus australis TaxID=614101 RepID=A0ABQ9I699_9NEOP|nr:hypothetical protein PR048_004748 [Dryococelus australis]
MSHFQLWKIKESRHPMPSQKYFSGNTIPKLYEELYEYHEVPVQLQTFGHILEMTTISLTVHFIGKNFDFRHISLDVLPFP